MRLSKEELEQVKKDLGVNKLWSWSKVNTFITSPYEYYLKYIAHAKEDRQDCSYATLGSICHSVLEDFYSGKIKYEEMLDAFEDGWLTAIDIVNLKFDRNDETRNQSIGSKYKNNLLHFFEHHSTIRHADLGDEEDNPWYDGEDENCEFKVDQLKKILDFENGHLELEQFIVVNINGNILQGYIDVLYKDYDGIYNIIDWKTSTQYKGKKAEDEAGQLVIYAIGLHQLGIPWEKIRICWNFLKYVTIRYSTAKGEFKYRDVERCKIGESLQANAKMWLKKLGYANQLDDYLKRLLDANDIDVLPEDVKAKYLISDCYTYVDLTEQLVNRWIDTVTTNIKDIELREQDYAESNNDKLFWDTEESVKAESYYFATLCGYSPSLHLPYKEYLEKLEAATNGTDTFGGLGTSISEEDNKSKCETPQDVDLSWLNEI